MFQLTVGLEVEPASATACGGIFEAPQSLDDDVPQRQLHLRAFLKLRCMATLETAITLDFGPRVNQTSEQAGS
jgi:hypothetical protein